MQMCGFCTRWFKSRQAVRAHLAFCELYLEKRDQGLVVPNRYARDVYQCANCDHFQDEDFSVCPNCATRLE